MSLLNFVFFFDFLLGNKMSMGCSMKDSLHLSTEHSTSSITRPYLSSMSDRKLCSRSIPWLPEQKPNMLLHYQEASILSNNTKHRSLKRRTSLLEKSRDWVTERSIDHHHQHSRLSYCIDHISFLGSTHNDVNSFTSNKFFESSIFTSIIIFFFLF